MKSVTKKENIFAQNRTRISSSTEFITYNNASADKVLSRCRHSTGYCYVLYVLISTAPYVLYIAQQCTYLHRTSCIKQSTTLRVQNIALRVYTVQHYLYTKYHASCTQSTALRVHTALHCV